MENRPLISLITVIYNGASTFEETVKSIAAQTYSNIEYIVIDGGSKDGTIDLIKKYEGVITYWISEPDKGIYDAMNKALTKVKGDWVLFLGADDLLNNVLHEIAPRLLSPDTVYYGNVYMTTSKIVYAGAFDKYKIAYKNICHQSIFYPRNMFAHYQFDLAYKIHADYDLNLRSFADKRYKFEYIDSVICQYNEAGFSTRNQDPFYSRRRFEILKEAYPPAVLLYARLRYWARKLIRRKN